MFMKSRYNNDTNAIQPRKTSLNVNSTHRESIKYLELFSNIKVKDPVS